MYNQLDLEYMHADSCKVISSSTTFGWAAGDREKCHRDTCKALKNGKMQVKACNNSSFSINSVVGKTERKKEIFSLLYIH